MNARNTTLIAVAALALAATTARADEPALDPDGPDTASAALEPGPSRDEPPSDAWSSLEGNATVAATARPAAAAAPPAVQISAGLGPSSVEAPDRARRWLLSASLGLHDCTGDLCDSDGLDTAPFLGQSFELYRRLNDYLALGVGFSALEMLPDSDDVTGNFLVGLVGLQGYLPVTERLDLWGGLAAGYGGALFELEWWSGFSTSSCSVTYHGPVVAFSAGLDFWTSSWLTLGPSFTYYLTLWQEVCTTGAGIDTCEDWDDLEADDREAETLDYWMVAFRTTMTF
ncbi:MAG: hypothetical protein JXB32_21080 [Deltaproteobacteria bacterium]|nr:hypothetical protein [Deltaproteobacteria bacterium]